jgi:hypothetical protein
VSESEQVGDRGEELIEAVRYVGTGVGCAGCFVALGLVMAAAIMAGKLL